jgi:hypothetical protein
MPMPLLDHFHPPLAELPPWSSIATTWAVSLTRWLNATLSTDEFIAFPTIHLGTHVEADVAEYDKRGNGSHVNGNGSVATLTEAPPAVGTFPVVFPDNIEVRVATSRHDWNLCGVIELVSGANKKEQNEREAFVTKCAAYLQRGIGVVVVDVVTNRLANLHNQLMRFLAGTTLVMSGDPPNYVASYRPVYRADRNEIDVWHYSVAVGSSLPAAPFALRGGPTLVVDLEGTYTEAIRDLGL